MTLSASILTDLIVSKYKEVIESGEDVIKDVIVTPVPQEDGTTEVELNSEMGPPELDEKSFRPLAQAIAEALVTHIQSSAEVIANEMVDFLEAYAAPVATHTHVVSGGSTDPPTEDLDPDSYPESKWRIS